MKKIIDYDKDFVIYLFEGVGALKLIPQTYTKTGKTYTSASIYTNRGLRRRTARSIMQITSGGKFEINRK